LYTIQTDTLRGGFEQIILDTPDSPLYDLTVYNRWLIPGAGNNAR